MEIELGKAATEAEEIIAKIDAGYGPRAEKVRRYIGASGIGNRCDAALAMALRGFPDDEIVPKLQRIFELGHKIETIVARDLKTKAKLQIMETDPMTGRQFSYHELGGHIRCNLDGLIEMPCGRLRNVEIKSMNANSWEKFQSVGVRTSHPHYFDQMMMQMAMSKTRDTLFIAYNKNTSMYHVEIVDFDPMAWEFLKARIERTLANRAARIASDDSDWRCRGCFKRSACWGLVEVSPQCYFCQHASAAEGGEWHCNKHDRPAVSACSDFERYVPRRKE